MFNLLTQSGTLGYGIKAIPEISLNWIGQLIRILIEGIGIVGVGIIIFTLILKTIVLPLDIYSRISGKKQALIMERMRPQMEKLQKQYANDKNMYNQKVVELQKKSGYSMFSACLPMVVSLVIFMVVFGAFSTYSQYANLNSYNKMVDVYNGVVKTYVIDENNPAVNENGFLYEIELDDGSTDYTVDYERFAAVYNKTKAESDSNWAIKSTDEVFIDLATDYKKANSSYAGSFDINMVNNKVEGELTETAVSIRNTLVNYYLEGPAAQEVKLFYEGGNDSYAKGSNNHFLWVRNLWYPDSTLYKELPDFSRFKSTVSRANIGDDYAESYNKVTAALDVQKGHYNGYFVLIILSIGLMLLQQWLSMRSNKSVNELSTVDGSGARTNKMMMVMMPLIYGIFSFMYSASFSIYMITNTLFGLITMLIINKCVDVWFKKKEASGELDAYLTKKSRKRAARANKRR